jgi:hypothetical protein
LPHLVKFKDGVSGLIVDRYSLFKSSVVEMPAKLKPMFSLLEGFRICEKFILKSLFHFGRSIAYFEKEIGAIREPPLLADSSSC